jgi:hypothetical protein
MATRRKIRDEQEARGLLDELRGSGLGMPEFCARAGVDGRSLNCWRVNLERRDAGDVDITPPPAAVRFLEVVGVRPPIKRAVYRVRLGRVVIEVDDDFEEDTLGRLLTVTSAW